MVQELWPTQINCRELKRRAMIAGFKSILVVSPCGSGKGTMIADDARIAAEKGYAVRITVHRRILVQQIAERLKLNGVRYTVEMSDLPDAEWAVIDPGAKVVVSSRDTALATLRNRGTLPECYLHIIDECHLFESHGYRQIQEAVKPKFTVGYTATPVLSDGTGLSDRIFETIIVSSTIEELIDAGRIVPVEVFAPVDTAKRRRKGLPVTVNGDPVHQWKRHAPGLRTATFCGNIRESIAVRDAFLKEGIPAAHIDQNTTHSDREEVLAQLLRRDILVLCNVFVAEVGWDFPALECVQLLTKCGSPVAFWQRLGRAMRTYDEEGKTRAVLLDHTAAMAEHGWPNVSPAWSLANREPLQRRQQERFGESAPAEMRPVICKMCGRGSVGARRCPTCGAVIFREIPAAPKVDHEPLSLIADAATFATGAKNYQKEWTSILYQAGAKSKPFTWANVVFKSKCHLWPEAAGVNPCPSFNDRQRLVADLYPQFSRRGATR